MNMPRHINRKPTQVRRRRGVRVFLRLLLPAVHEAVRAGVPPIDGKRACFGSDPDHEHRGVQRRKDQRKQRQMQRERKQRDLSGDHGIVRMRKIFVGTAMRPAARPATR